MTLSDDIQSITFKYIGQSFTGGITSLVEDDLVRQISGDVRIKSSRSKTALDATVKQYTIAPSIAQYPDTSQMEPGEAANVLVEAALFPFIGRRRSPRQIQVAISRAIEQDERLTLVSVSVEADQVVVRIESRSLQLIYDGISDYSGNYFYG